LYVLYTYKNNRYNIFTEHSSYRVVIAGINNKQTKMCSHIAKKTSRHSDMALRYSERLLETGGPEQLKARAPQVGSLTKGTEADY